MPSLGVAALVCRSGGRRLTSLPLAQECPSGAKRRSKFARKGGRETKSLKRESCLSGSYLAR